MMHENTILKAKRVQEIVAKYYEPERRDRCKHEIWRRHVYPVYPMCYSNFKRLLTIDVERELQRAREAKNSVPVNFPDTLFSEDDFL